MKKAGYRINLIVQKRFLAPSKKALARAAKKTLKLEAASGGVLNLFFTSDAGIAELNRRFLRRKGPTDVIAFGSKGEGLIGEVAISVDRARDNAKRFKTAFGKELFLYVIHGILHLLGYEDETKGKRAVMEKRQALILAQICRY